MSISDSFARVISSLLQESVSDILRIETMEDDQTLVMKDGTMVSMLHLHGALGTPDENELMEVIEQLRIALSPYLSNPGHIIEFSFLRDAGAARRQLRTSLDKIRLNSGSLGLDIEDVLAERDRVLSDRMVSETMIISLFTLTDVLEKEEVADEARKYKESRENAPFMLRGHDPNKGMDLVHTRHSAFVDAMSRTLTKSGQLNNVMSVTQMLQEVRAGVYPEYTAQKTEWTPRLPEWAKADGGMKSMVMMPETDEEAASQDFSHLFQPSFDRQIATEDAIIENSRTVRMGGLILSGFDMTLAPETLPNFDNLVDDVTAKSAEIPWRCSIKIESGGMHSQSLKATFLSIFAFSNPGHNKRVKDAIDSLREIDGHSDAVVKFRMSFATWAKIGQDDVLRRNTQTLNGAVLRWGNCRADGISGDPLATLMSTVPGATLASTAPVAAAPLAHALAMAPLSRQASPWDSGAVLLRTDDGKPWPFQPGSSKQTTWITLLVGTPGSGKSVMMNAINFASAITPSTAGGAKPVLPRLAMIDIGPSSSGMISLIQEALPADRRHEVAFKKLKMHRDHAINVFDTQLGMRRPTANERQFLINFLSLICSSGIEAPSSSMRGLISASVDRAYLDHEEMNYPRRFLRDENGVVDRALDELGFQDAEETIWWEVVDFLAAAGKLHEASVAQRYAVPTLGDLVTAAQSEQVSSLYASAIDQDTGQPIIESFQRVISEVVRDFPILATHTMFSIDQARIVSLDLMEVTVGGASAAAKKQTALMYMLARQVLTRDFFLDEVEFRSAAKSGDLPDQYLKHHVERARQNLQLPKLLCMDEFHRTGKIEMICEQVLQDGREGRKFNIDLKIASQLIEDFPESIIQIASTLIVCNAGSEASIDLMDENFRLSEGERDVMRRQLTGPTRKGAPIWGLFKLKGDGTARQKLNLTLGPAELWAFSTTAEDVALRSLLYEAIGPRLTRQVLARRFPGGSAKSEIEAQVARMEESGQRIDKEGRVDIIGNLVEDLKKQAYLLQDNL